MYITRWNIVHRLPFPKNVPRLLFETYICEWRTASRNPANVPPGSTVRPRGPEIHPHYFPLDSRGIHIGDYRETARHGTLERNKRGSADFVSLESILFTSFSRISENCLRYYRKEERTGVSFFAAKFGIGTFLITERIFFIKCLNFTTHTKL